MVARLLADLVLLIHLAFILFALLGGILLLWRRWIVLVHLPSLVWAVLVEYNGWICPLTPLENMFRHAAGAAGEGGYSTGFIEKYLQPIICPEGLTLNIQIALVVFLLVVNATIYSLVLFRMGKSQSGDRVDSDQP